MTMLGAQLDDLATLGSRLQATAGDVATNRDQSVGTTSQVIAEVTDATRRSLDQITTHMQALGASVDGAIAQADATQWTGANAERFRAGAAEFRSSMHSAQATTTEAFASFQASVATMSETLNGFIEQFSAAMTGAEASAGEMSAAVEAQRTNLDQVMNQGLTFD